MMSTSTLIARDELDINGRSCRSSGLATSSAFGDDSFGTLRRSLRQICSFKKPIVQTSGHGEDCLYFLHTIHLSIPL
ncbi:hypothetical protein Ddc_08050 [Ditylenchus destructor]|nr:hypothetical protein Ddc_08050 [Ditylenchus destructor]